MEQGGKIVDPLIDPEADPQKTYDIHFVGIQGQEVTTAVAIKRKIWFDGEVLNDSAATPWVFRDWRPPASLEIEKNSR